MSAVDSGISCLFFDFGGVFTTSPFAAFSRYEQAQGLPTDFIRRVNSQQPNDNAWARFERGELSEAQFDQLFAAESVALGYRVPGSALLPLLACDLVPEMLAQLRQWRERFICVCVTNNAYTGIGPSMQREAEKAAAVECVMRDFHHVVESRVLGLRKPEPRFYQQACAIAGVRPQQVLYVDDLGINLKPARALGMHTIKAVSALQLINDMDSFISIK